MDTKWKLLRAFRAIVQHATFSNSSLILISGSGDRLCFGRSCWVGFCPALLTTWPSSTYLSMLWPGTLQAFSKLMIQPSSWVEGRQWSFGESKQGTFGEWKMVTATVPTDQVMNWSPMCFLTSSLEILISDHHLAGLTGLANQTLAFSTCRQSPPLSQHQTMVVLLAPPMPFILSKIIADLLLSPFFFTKSEIVLKIFRKICCWG